jgi:formate/nitrite transporter FocA (FNT family)
VSFVAQSRRLRRHPIQGFLGGLFLGLGAVILLAVSGVAAFSAWWPFAVIVGGCAIVGVLIGLFAPPRAPA